MVKLRDYQNSIIHALKKENEMLNERLKARK
jgi:hypothetical protein